MADLFERVLAEIEKGLEETRKAGAVVGPVINLRVTKDAK